MKADTIKDVDIKRLLLKLESAFLTHQEVEELVDKVKMLEQDKAELVEALEGVMEWQVKNVDTWHNSAYDHAAEIIAKAKGEE